MGDLDILQTGELKIPFCISQTYQLIFISSVFYNTSANIYCSRHAADLKYVWNSQNASFWPFPVMVSPFLW